MQVLVYDILLALRQPSNDWRHIFMVDGSPDIGRAKTKEKTPTGINSTGYIVIMITNQARVKDPYWFAEAV